MRKYSIIPLKVGIMRDKKYFLMYPPLDSEEVEIVSIIYVILGGEEIIVVDTGCANSEWSKKNHHPVFYRDADQQPANALAKLHIKPEDVKIVVNTHLHWDHCFNNRLFSNARCFVQEAELRYAVSPLPIHSHGYCCYKKEKYGGPPWIDSFNQMVPIRGDLEILPGLTLIFIPGHTPGGQGLLIETGKGPYIIVSDFCPLFENWEGKGWLKHIPATVHSNLDDYYNSFKRIEELRARILPGHDPRVFEKKSFP